MKSTCLLTLLYIFLVYFSIDASKPIAQKQYTFTHRVENVGFFSVFNAIIGCLNFCEKNNAGLTIDFKNNGWYYCPTKGPNWWRYYFEQPKMQPGNVTKTELFKAYEKIIFAIEGQFSIKRTRAHELIQKYIVIKPHIHKLVDDFYAQHMKGHFVIGIHYRGTDKTEESPHVTYQKVCGLLKNQLIKYSNQQTKIFVATDDANLVALMQKKYPVRLCAINAIRSKDKQSVHIHLKADNYKKGQDALVDCLLLSKCQVLIKNASNLSDTSQMFNPKIKTINISHHYFE